MTVWNAQCCCNQMQLNMLPANLSICETFHIVFACTWPASPLGLFFILTIIRLTLWTWWVALQFELWANIAVTVICLHLRRATHSLSGSLFRPIRNHNQFQPTLVIILFWENMWIWKNKWISFLTVNNRKTEQELLCKHQRFLSDLLKIWKYMGKKIYTYTMCLQ